MSMNSSAPPQVQDPNKTAATQQAFNTSAAAGTQAMNAMDQNTAFANLRYKQTGTGPGGVPIYEADTTLSPQNQAIVDALAQGRTTAGTNANDMLSWYTAPQNKDPTSVIGDATKGNTSALIKSFTDYMNPSWDRDEERLRTQLNNKGLSAAPPGSPPGAYEQAMTQFRLDRDRVRTGAISQFEPQAYQQAANNYLMPLSMGGQMLNLAQPFGTGFVTTPTTQLPAANYAQTVASATDAENRAYQQKLQQDQAMWSAGAQLAGTAVGAAVGGPAGASMGRAAGGWLIPSAPGAPNYSGPATSSNYWNTSWGIPSGPPA